MEMKKGGRGWRDDEQFAMSSGDFCVSSGALYFIESRRVASNLVGAGSVATRHARMEFCVSSVRALFEGRLSFVTAFVTDLQRQEVATISKIKLKKSY